MTHDPVEPRKPLTSKQRHPTIDRICELLDYDPETGLFTWRVPRLIGKGMRTLKPGSVAGTLRKGYILIGIDGTQYSAHRIAWLITHGEWPACDIDHINHDRKDNRIANLRTATRGQNLANSSPRTDNTNGTPGVWYWAARRKWKAFYQGRTLGYFVDRDDAVAAYKQAKETAYGKFGRCQ